jgi:hypothetical protein
MVVYEDVILDERVFLAGANGSNMRQNDRTINQGGYVSVNAVRDVTLRQFQLGVKPMEVDLWQEIEGVYEITDSGVFGFLVKDPKDQVVDTAEGAFQGYMSGVEFGVPGFGNGTPTYGFRKIYKARSSTRTKARALTRLNGTPSMYRGGTPLVEGASAGNVSVSAGPSYITFAADASRSVSAVTVGVTTQITLSSAITGFVVNGRLWLQDLTGADAALLNNMSHQITVIAGAAYTIATNTAGKTITAAGTGKKYPQPDEALTWTGEFYVPVQFAEDSIDWDLVRPGAFGDRLVSAPAVTLVEIREA